MTNRVTLNMSHNIHYCYIMNIVVVVRQAVGSIFSKTLAYDSLCTLELCTASMIATSSLGHLGDFLPIVCPSYSVLLLTTSLGRTFQVVVILIR